MLSYSVRFIPYRNLYAEDHQLTYNTPRMILMKIRFISILFLCTCILIGTLTGGVFAGPTSGDIPSPGADEQA